MQVSVLGLGYVGCVTAACLAKAGHRVIGVDVNPVKVDTINAGQSPLLEPGLDELIKETVTSGLLSATQDTTQALDSSQVAIVCVGTPSRPSGRLDLTFLERVSQDIGLALRQSKDRHTIVIRSTILPGTLEECVIPILEQSSGLKAEKDFGVCVNPEFMREGTALRDFCSPPFTLIGELDSSCAGDIFPELYAGIDAPLIRTNVRTAEMLKYVNNAWHAIKVTFANEIGTMCHAEGIDGKALMALFCKDSQLNISAAYLKPGFAFGGSCLPKELRALVYHSHQREVQLPLLASVLPSNEEHIMRAYRKIMNIAKRKVALIGLSFKSGTDDLRESPLVTLAELLIGKGYDLRIYDPDVRLSQLVGANRAYIDNEIPHIGRLLTETLDQVLDQEVIVIGKRLRELEGDTKPKMAHLATIDLTD